MGKKRQTDLQRTISFGMNADEVTLRTAVETLSAILGEKFKKGPKPPIQSATSVINRVSRKLAETQRQVQADTVAKASEEVS